MTMFTMISLHMDTKKVLRDLKKRRGTTYDFLIRELLTAYESETKLPTSWSQK